MAATEGCAKVLCLGNWKQVNTDAKPKHFFHPSANATLRASGMPSIQNIIFKAAKQVSSKTRVGSGVSLFNLSRTIVDTLPGTCRMKECLFSRSVHLDWTRHLCTTTGSSIPTGQAGHMEPFPGNELQPHLSNFPTSRNASWGNN